jgi:hypothetical protein
VNNGARADVHRQSDEAPRGGGAVLDASADRGTGEDPAGDGRRPSGYVDYDRAFRKITGKRGMHRQADARGGHAGAGRERRRPPSAETREETSRARAEVGNLLGARTASRVMTCACGVGIKIPPGSQWTLDPLPPLRPGQSRPESLRKSTVLIFST